MHATMMFLLLCFFVVLVFFFALKPQCLFIEFIPGGEVFFFFNLDKVLFNSV